MARKYVDQDNVNAADEVAHGSEALPYLTLNYGYGQATASVDDVFVKDSVAVYKHSTSFFWNKNVPLEGESRDGTIITCETDNTRVIRMANNAKCRFANFTMIPNEHNPKSYGFQVNGVDMAGGEIDNIHFASPVQLGFIRLESGLENLVVKNCLFEIGALGNIIYDGGCKGFDFDDNIITVVADNVSNGLYHQVVAGNVGQIRWRRNRLDDLAANTRYIYSVNGGQNSWLIEYNTVGGLVSTYARNFITLRDELDYVVKDNNFTLNADGVIECLAIQSPLGTTPASIQVLDNVFDTFATSNHVIFIGEENATGNHDPNKFSDSTGALLVRGNTLYSGAYNGRDDSADTAHMIMVGYDIDFTIRENTVFGGAFGTVFKGETPFTKGGAVGNKYINCVIAGRIKGVGNVPFVNNTVVDQGKNSQSLSIDKHETGNATNHKNYNNIYKLTTGAVYGVDADSASGFEADYNCYDLSGTAIIGTINGVTYNTLAEFQAAGFALNSHSEPALLDGNYNVIPFTRNWQTGIPRTEITPLESEDGEAITLSGGTLINDTLFKRLI